MNYLLFFALLAASLAVATTSTPSTENIGESTWTHDAQGTPTPGTSAIGESTWTHD